MHQTSTGTGAHGSPSGSASRTNERLNPQFAAASLSGNETKQNSTTTPFSIQIQNKQNMFDGYAGYDGQGGFHGTGGHENQIGLRKTLNVSNQKESKLSIERQVYEGKQGNPVVAQHGLLPTKQIHSNRQQRAVQYFVPQDGNSAKASDENSPERYMKEFKQFKEGTKGFNNDQIATATDFLAQSNPNGQVQPNSQSQYAFGYKPGAVLKQNINMYRPPAGYGNFGPQMISHEQTYGDSSTRVQATNRAAISGVASRDRNRRNIEPLGSHFNTAKKVSQTEEQVDVQQKPSLFQTIKVPTIEFEHRASNLVYDTKQLMNKLPSKPQNRLLVPQQLAEFEKKYNSRTSLLEKRKLTEVNNPIFQQSPFWSNLNEHSIASSTMNKSAVRSNKYIGLPLDPRPDGTRIECQLLVSSVLNFDKPVKHKRNETIDYLNTNNPSFSIGLSPLINPPGDLQTVRTLGSIADQPPHFGSIGQDISKYDKSIDISKEMGNLTTEMPSKLEDSRFEESRLFQNQDRSYIHTDEGTFNLITMRAPSNRTFGSQQKNRASPPSTGKDKYETMKDITHLHMYDSLLLSEKAMPKKYKPSLRTQSFNVGKFRSNQVYQTASNNKFDISVPGRVQQMASPKGRQLAPLNLKPCLQKDVGGSEIYERYTESSAQSNVNEIVFGDNRIETMKGTKINQLSPLTRKLNQVSKVTGSDLEAIAQRLRLKQQMHQDRLINKQEGNGQKTTPSMMLAENNQMIKILKNELKSTIAPEEEKYQILVANNPNYLNVEVLPDLLPVYVKVSCPNLKTPCLFEIVMEGVEALHMMISTEHKFPQEENKEFEKEKLFIQDSLIQMQVDEEMKGASKIGKNNKEKKKTALMMIEASSKIAQQTPSNQNGEQTKRSKRKIFKFAKAGYKDYFSESETLYIAFVSQQGGTIKAKALFPNNHGGFGPVDILAVAASNEVKAKEGLSDDQIVGELDRWCSENLHMVKNLLNTTQNFVDLNREDRLQKFSLSNFVFEHQKKMFMNHERRAAANNKAGAIEEGNWQKNKLNLTKWEDYRENKIELTHIFIKVMKRKNFTRRWLIWHKVIQKFMKVRENLFIRRNLNYIHHMSRFTAVRFKWVYKMKYQREYGLQMSERRRKQIRGCLNFGAMVKYATIEKDVTQYLGNFIFKTFLIFDTCKRFTRFNDNVLHIQNGRQHLLMTRQFRFQLFFGRLEKHKDFLVAYYAKKKGRKYAKNASKNLKKIFNKSSEENFQKIKSQLDIIGVRNQLDCKTLTYSIHVRALLLTHQIMALSKNKDEEGNQVYKEEIVTIKDQMNDYFKKINKILDKIKKLGIDLYGLPDKEIKEIQRQCKGRRPTPQALALNDLHKHDTNKMVKDDKTDKECGKWFKKEEKKRAERAAQASKGVQEEDKDADDGEGVEGEDGPEIGEGDMEGEGDGDGADGEPGEPAEGENAEGAEGAEPGEDGEKQADDGEMGGEGEEGAGDGGSDGGGDMEDGKDEMDGGMEGVEQSPSQAALETAGGEDAKEAKSPTKKGSKGRSVSKTKKKKTGDENKIELVLYKPSAKTKGRYIINEKIANPPEILEAIAERYEEGVNAMSSLQIRGIVEEMYRRPEKLKLIQYYEALKLKPVTKSIHRFLLHLAVNIGPQAKANEDIEDTLKETIKAPTESGSPAKDMDATMVTEVPALDETIIDEGPAAETTPAVVGQESETPGSKEKALKGDKTAKAKGKPGKKGEEGAKKTPPSKTPTKAPAMELMPSLQKKPDSADSKDQIAQGVQEGVETKQEEQKEEETAKASPDADGDQAEEASPEKVEADGQDDELQDEGEEEEESD